jgi:glycosyltransferase involved in cell wall biosynthesis
MTRRAVVLSDAPGNSGGVERTSNLLRRVLEERGWSVSIVAPGGEPPRWASRIGAASVQRSHAVLAPMREDGQLDLLITASGYGLWAPPGVARIHVYHGTMVEHTLRGDLDQPLRERARRVLGEGFAEAMAGRGAVRVAVSESAAREVRRWFRLDVDEVIPNGVDTDLFHPRERAEARRRLGLGQEARLALFVGRTEARKGADLLLPACERAGFELVVAGRNTLPGARGLGVLSPEDTAWAYAAADCVLFPTRYEACSWVVLEALASGTPLLTTRVGWMETFLRELPAYRALCVWPEVEDLAAGLRALADDPRPEVTAAARDWIERNAGYGRFAERWGALIDRVAGPPPSV